jgi:bidirectional [NiFe] hydrogenase diaphorase subunit
VCTGSACYVNGADALTSAVTESSGVKLGETTPDGAVSVLAARCLGACGVAPVVILDGTIKGDESPAGLLSEMKGWVPGGIA